MKDHEIVLIIENAVIQMPAGITGDGDVETTGGWDLLDGDDSYVYCETCKASVQSGDGHGLAEDWQEM